MRRLLLLSVLLLLLAPGAQATAPGTNGRIAYLRLELQNSPESGGLWVLNADGTGVHRLTHPPNGTVDANPDWSRNGTRLVFTRQPARGAFSIWVVNAGGSGPKRISPPCPPGSDIPKCPADDSWPVWSPDGRRIAFQRLAGALRPKGATLADNPAIYKDELVIADADGSNVRTLVWRGPWRGDPQAPAWSPDGNRLVFLGNT